MSALSTRRHALWSLAALALSLLLTNTAALAGSNDKKSGAPPTTSSKNYDLYRTGSALDALPPKPATSMLVLMGGGTDVDEAFRQMIAKARGNNPAQKVDVVVVRTSGADGYNPSLYAMDGVDSVESLVIKTRVGAEDTEVNRIVAAADVLFIAGGDQSTYISLWKGTALDRTLQALATAKVPLGGTSAGLAVLGRVDYTGATGSITSATALANPYDRTLTLDDGFLNALPWMGGTITDSHLVARDRMGRLITFMARMIQDGLTTLATTRGIGLDEETALVVDNGLATVVGNPDGQGGTTGTAYFLKPTLAPTVIAAKKPLTFRTIQIERRRAGGQYDLVNWPAITPTFTSAEAGVLMPSPY